MKDRITLEDNIAGVTESHVDSADKTSTVTAAVFGLSLRVDMHYLG